MQKYYCDILKYTETIGNKALLGSLLLDFGEWEFISPVLPISINRFSRDKLVELMSRNMGFTKESFAQFIPMALLN